MMNIVIFPFQNCYSSYNNNRYPFLMNPDLFGVLKKATIAMISKEEVVSKWFVHVGELITRISKSIGDVVLPRPSHYHSLERTSRIKNSAQWYCVPRSIATS